MSYPEWVTPSNLGTFSQDYSFDVNPIIIQYGANAGSVITQISGSLPAGLSLDKTGSVIKVIGICVPTLSILSVKFTLRIVQTNGLIADRTFLLTLNPVALSPSWVNQQTFLGYQNNTLPQSYTLRAIPPAGQHITYNVQAVSVTPFVPVSVSINPLTGLLVSNAANVIINNTIIDVTVRAQANLYSDITCSIEVITVPSAPEWITPAGVLGTYAGGDFIEINLEAKDLNNQKVTYSLFSNPNGAPLQVAADGLLYGRFDNISVDTSYSITVKAQNSVGNSFRTFILNLVPSESISLLKWITDSDLGSIDEGKYYSIPVEAVTQRNRIIVYNLSGGTLPPNMLIGKTDGVIEGYCEYHAVPKTYTFELSATDGYQTIIKKFDLTVNKKYGDIFFGINIPLAGPLRNQWISDAGDARAREPGTRILDSFKEIQSPPTLNVIRGVITGYDSDNDLYNELSPWLHQFDLQFGSAANTSISSDNTLVYRNINDYQLGANLTVYSQSVYNTNVQTNGTVTPISLENIRRKITQNRLFINSGSGSGASLVPVLNYSTGGIKSVTVVNPGSNYTSPPTIKISGSGTGAVLRSILGIVDVTILNCTNGWEVGDIIELPIGRYTTVGQITVTGVNPAGSVISYVIDYTGDYQQIPLTEFETFDKNSNTNITFKINWGITGVEVIDSGINYQNSAKLDVTGNELLPWWQDTWSSAIAVGNINGVSGSTVTNLLNYEENTLYGNRWQPNYVVFYWEGLRWLGTSSFDDEYTTFDGNATRFEEAESAYETIFDDKLTRFDDYYTLFDYVDPLEYDIAVIWGTTIFDERLTVFEFNATAFDKSIPKKSSNTVYPKLIRVNNKTYSGNNAVW